jgi:3-oxoacyl-[acyl-carrier protein] reductase
MGKSSKLLLFGGTGAIGSEVATHFRKRGWAVMVAGRQAVNIGDYICWNPLAKVTQQTIDILQTTGPFDAVCWAQGKNCNDNVYSFDVDEHYEVYDANLVYIMKSLQLLLNKNLLTKPSRLCIISSIWQDISRQNKLSYGVTKSAIKGLVLSAANDLGKDGHLINAVLPGALDTPMTHKNLTEVQLSKVVNSTQFGRLARLGDVANIAFFLCSPENTGITGQFIKADLGYSSVRII